MAAIAETIRPNDDLNHVNVKDIFRKVAKLSQVALRRGRGLVLSALITEEPYKPMDKTERDQVLGKSSMPWRDANHNR